MKYLFIFISILGFSNQCKAQYSDYTLNKEDSTILLMEPYKIVSKGRYSSWFYIKLNERIAPHPYHVLFEIINTENDTISLIFGTEGHIQQVTRKMTLAPGEKGLVEYTLDRIKMDESFTQEGQIGVFQNDEYGCTNSRRDLSGSFFISGKWE